MNKNLNIFLFKRHLKFKSYIVSKHRDKIRTNYIDKDRFTNIERGIIFIYDSPESLPEWKNDLEQLSEKKSLLIESRKTSSAILFLTIIQKSNGEKSTVALTFGPSSFLLDPEEIVHDFGITVSKGLLTRSELTSIDSTYLDRKIFNTRKQSTAFLLPEKILDDNSQSILRKVQGKYSKNLRNFSLGGSRSLNFKGDINLPEDISGWINDFIDVYSAANNNLGLEDSLLTVSRNEKVSLDKKLGEKILKITQSHSIDARNLSSLRIIPPAIFDVEKFNGFFIDGLGYKFSNSPSDFYIDEVNFFKRLQQRLKSNPLNKIEVINKLKNTNILIKEDGEDDPQKICTVYQAINFEISLNDKKYSLLNGIWYEVERSFYESICKEINSIKPPEHSAKQNKVNFINFKESRDFNYRKGKRHLSEGKYNENLSIHNKVLMLDRTNFSPAKEIAKKFGYSPYDKIEICDVFDFDEEYVQFIHIKRHSGAAGTSHLLMQALVSANCFINDKEEIKRFINKHITENKSPVDYKGPSFEYNKQQQEVILGIVDVKYKGTQKNSDLLSLLEMISVRESVRKLKALGFNCYLKFIKTEK